MKHWECETVKIIWNKMKVKQLKYKLFFCLHANNCESLTCIGIIACNIVEKTVGFSSTVKQVNKFQEKTTRLWINKKKPTKIPILYFIAKCRETYLWAAFGLLLDHVLCMLNMPHKTSAINRFACQISKM